MLCRWVALEKYEIDTIKSGDSMHMMQLLQLINVKEGNRLNEELQVVTSQLASAHNWRRLSRFNAYIRS